MACQIDGYPDSMSKPERISAAMTLHCNTVKTEENRAVVAPRVDSLAELVHGRSGKQIAQAGEQRTAKSPPEKLGVQCGGTFCSLERDVAGEAIGHNHVDGSLGDIISFHKADKLTREGQGAQQGGCFLQRFAALHVFRSNIQESAGRLWDTQNAAGEAASHDSKLNKVPGVARDVCPHVQHHRFSPKRREEGA